MIARSVIAGSCALVVATLLGERVERPTAAAISACTARGAGTLASEHVELGFRGEVPRCDADHTLTTAFVVADGLIESLPLALRPGFVTIDLRPSGSRFEAVPDDGVLVVAKRHATADLSVWLHEIAHLSAHGPRPRAPAARKIAVAIDEGVADYFAAAITGSSQIGRGVGQERDLARPPPLPSEAWAMLAVGDFDPHRFGWALAALLWNAEPRAGHLLEDCVRCLAGGALEGAESPAAVLAALARSCPERSRTVLARALESWAPEELFPTSQP